MPRQPNGLPGLGTWPQYSQWGGSGDGAGLAAACPKARYVPYYEEYPALQRETWRPDIRAAVLVNQRTGRTAS
ncbi:hypothetical protein OG453_44095 [Streptomyces sp. NBC_01381]|uniref:hypothetical protein n=1 Tax=Streptomyces sp. NBC_01381 TaxID=2903845 RepID=UPI00225B5C89|nr:hypothetical protein [Streptomyces sp. NBC_01381]MCX4673542.1 hypothetical protein [Streptomyces sp. NBC_01381]